MNQQNIAIVGAGVGGLSVGLGLLRSGRDIAIYEQAPVVEQVGAGLTLWANALQALGQLGLAEAVIAEGIQMEQGCIQDWRGKLLTVSPIGQVGSAPTIGIHRANLHRLLLAAVGRQRLHLGRRLAHFEQDEQGVILYFEGGQAERADLLIGADGLRSRVRQELFPAGQPRYAGYTVWRGIAPLANEQVKPGFAFESWGYGQRFGLLRVSRDNVYWFAVQNGPAGQLIPLAQRQAYLQKQFAGWHQPIQTVLAATPAESFLQNDSYDLSPMPRWFEGRVVLLGDAIHATTPNMGQGACQAIESAVFLAHCLAVKPDHEAAFASYQQVRQERTAWITNQSWLIGQMGQLQNRWLCAIRNRGLRLTPTMIAGRALAKAADYTLPTL